MAGVLGIEYVLPSGVLSNDVLSKDFSTWSADKIEKKTGISTRRVVGDGETAVDLGTAAAEKLLSSGLVERDKIDYLILVTQSPDYILPPSACIIQNKLKLNTKCGAIDVNLGCSGFVYGLMIAKSLVDSRVANKVLLITAETYTKYINRNDKSTRTIFGDAAAATLIGEEGFQIGEFDYGTDGSGQDLLKIPVGGARNPKTLETVKEKEYDGNFRNSENLYMDGPGIMEFTVREVPGSISRLLEKEQLDMDSVDLFILHQANEYILRFLQRKLEIGDDRFYIDMRDTGNTVSASIPIALKRAMEKGVLRGKNRVLLCGFGVGLSWASTMLYMEDKNDSI